MTHDEVDIVESSFRHMLAEGVDLILVADQSTDGTREILWALGTKVLVWPHDDETNRQVEVMNSLVRMASRNYGADWVIPFDADEYPYSPDGRTLRESLSAVPASIDKLYTTRYLHNDWNTRRFTPERLPKVVFRPVDGVTVDVGNHDCSLSGGVFGWLESRELQYRGFDHFLRKSADRIARLPESERAKGSGTHHERLRGMTEEQLRAEFDALLALPSVYDPIPSRTHIRPKENG
jgi:glycosyltransferase involved in cell wall biosynthesis